MRPTTAAITLIWCFLATRRTGRPGRRCPVRIKCVAEDRYLDQDELDQVECDDHPERREQRVAAPRHSPEREQVESRNAKDCSHASRDENRSPRECALGPGFEVFSRS